jgi:hypothetical protein
MSRFAWMFIWIAAPAMFAAAPVAAQTAIPDVRGTWKGDSETIVLDAANPHHAPTQSNEPHLRSSAFTLTIDKQDGRRFSGRFLSARGSERVIAVFSRSGTILLADDDGYTLGTMLAPNRMELCHLHVSPTGRVASCLELTKQP